MLPGPEIRALRERLDLSQRDFGELLGIARINRPGPRVKSWEDENVIPCFTITRHMRTLTAVANAILALELNRFEAVRLCLEQVFKDTGADALTEKQVKQMERESYV